MIGMTVLNPLCSVLAMRYASPSILAPFSGLTLVWIVLLSHRLIGEAPTVTQVIAAMLIVLGEVVVAVYGDHYNDAVTVEQVVRNSNFYESVWCMFDLILILKPRRQTYCIVFFFRTIAASILSGGHLFMLLWIHDILDALVVLLDVSPHNRAQTQTL